MKFSKNCGTSSYLKVDAVGSAGYEPRVLTAELMARTVVFYIIAEFLPLPRGMSLFFCSTMAVKGALIHAAQGVLLGGFPAYHLLYSTVLGWRHSGFAPITVPDTTPAPSPTAEPVASQPYHAVWVSYLSGSR